MHETGAGAGRLGEQLFERYLTERGYAWRAHPDLGIGKRPDYLVDIEGVRIVCEAKAFNTEGAFPTTGGTFGSRSMDKVLAPHRDDIKSSKLGGDPKRSMWADLGTADLGYQIYGSTWNWSV